MIDLKKTDQGIVETEHTLAIDGEYDVIVVGAGPAGVGAGIAASKAGCKTLIIEDTSALGGLLTMGLVNIPLDPVSGIGQEMFDELEAVTGLWHRNSDPEKNKLVLDRMVKKAGCDVLLLTKAVDSIVMGNKICGVVTESKAGRKAILAKRVIDCSGDADVAYFAGVEVNMGRASDGMNQACSLDFRLGGVDWDTYVKCEIKAKDPRWLEIIKKGLSSGDLPFEVDNHLNWLTHVPGRPEHCGMDEVSICFAHSRNCKPLDNHDLTRMYFEGREEVDFLWKFIKKYVPGFERAYVVDTAPLLGVRDTRRIVGEYVLTGYDVVSCAQFDDVICLSNHGFDVHGPDCTGNQKWIEMEFDGEKKYAIFNMSGIGSTTLPPDPAKYVNYKGEPLETAAFDRKYHEIPYRSLVPLKVDNLLVAGRCLSSDFMAQSAFRLIIACMTMGEAAGTATAISLKKDIVPRKVERLELQKTLVDNGVNIGQHYRQIPGVN